MKVCMISGSFPPIKCGVGDYTKKLCENLLKISGLKLDLITSKKAHNYAEEETENFKIHNCVEKFSFVYLNQILKVIENIKPDIIHIQYPTTEYRKNMCINFLPLILRLKGYIVYSTVHEYSYLKLMGRIRNMINIMFSNKNFVVDPQYIQDIKKSNPFIKNIKFMPISSNIKKVELLNDEKQEIRSNYFNSLKKETRILGYFGFIYKSKGLEHILDAIKELNDEGYDYRLVIMSELRENDDYHDTLKTKIGVHKYKSKIFITGYLDEVNVSKNIQSVDCMVLPFVDGLSVRNGSFLASLEQAERVITTHPMFDISKVGILFESVIFIDRKDISNQLIDVLKKDEHISLGKSDISAIFNWDYITSCHKNEYLLNKND